MATQSEEIQKILDIRVNYGDAINAIAAYNAQIEQLKASQQELKQAVEEGTITEQQATKERAASNEMIKACKDGIRALSREVQNNVKEQQQQEGSLKQLRAQLSNLTKEYDELSRAERQGAKGKELQDKLNAVTTELKKAEEETQRYYRNVGNYNGAIKPMRTELRELTMALAELERQGLRGSEQYNEMAKRAGTLKDNIADARAEIAHQASDTRLLDDATNIITTATTAWQGYQGAVQAFGIDSQEAMQAMAKLQGIISMTNAVQTLATRFTDNSSASYKVFHKVLQLVGLEKKKNIATTQAETAAQQTNNTATAAGTAAQVEATAGTAAHTAATTSLTVGLSATTVAAKALRVVLATLGIGLVVAAVAALIEGVSALVGWLSSETEEEKKAREQQELLAEAMREGAEAAGKAAGELMDYKLKIDQFNGSARQERKLVEELNSKYGEAMGHHKSLAQWKTVLAKNGKAYIQMILLEAQAQALMNRYTGKYIEMLNFRMMLEKGGMTSSAAAMAAQLAYGEEMNYIMRERNKVMAEANTIASQYNFGGYSAPTSSGGGSSPSRSTKSAADTASKELQDIRKAQDEATKLIKDENERRRKELELQYDRQIEDLRNRLAKEKNLTAAQREAINSQIVSLEQQKQIKLNELSEKQTEMRLKREAEYTEQLLRYVEKGSLDEYNLRIAKIAKEEELRKAAINREITDEAEKNKALAMLDKELAEQRAQAEQEYNEGLLKGIREDFELRYIQARDNEIEQMRLKEEEMHQLLLNTQQRQGETEKEFALRRAQQENEWLDAKQERIEKEQEVERAKYEAIGGYMSGLAEIAGAFEEDSKTMAKASKILALGEVAIQTGVAIAKGVAAAQSMPFPKNIAAVVTTITQVMTNIATATKSIKSAKFAEGGVVRGSGTATSDSIPARLSNGESVMTAATTSMFAPILSTLNQLGGGVPIVVQSSQAAVGEDMLAAAVAKGMAYAPTPVVSVEEINRTQKRVETIEQLATY